MAGGGPKTIQGSRCTRPGVWPSLPFSLLHGPAIEGGHGSVKDRAPQAVRRLRLYPHNQERNPRPVFSPHLVAAMANHPRGLQRPGKQVFRWHKGGRLYNLLRQDCPRCWRHLARTGGVPRLPAHLRNMDAPLRGFGHQGLYRPARGNRSSRPAAMLMPLSARRRRKLVTSFWRIRGKRR